MLIYLRKESCYEFVSASCSDDDCCIKDEKAAYRNYEHHFLIFSFTLFLPLSGMACAKLHKRKVVP